MFLLGLVMQANAQLNPNVIAISVDTTDLGNMGAVRIFYDQYSNPDIERYQLRHFYNGRPIVEVENIGNTGEFLFTQKTKADEQSEGIQLRAVSISSPSATYLSKINYTIFLEVDNYDHCEKTLTLHWNNYIGWDNNIAGYDVYVKEGNSSYSKQTTTTDTTYTITNISALTTYKFYVVAHNSISAAKSMSNIASYTTEVLLTINESLFYIDGVVNNGSSVNIHFQVDNVPELTGYNVLMSPSINGTFNNIGFVENTAQTSYSFTHEGADLGLDYFYKVQIVDDCTEPLGETNMVEKINLEGDDNSNTVSLQWNPCFIGKSETYSLLMSVDGSAFTTLRSDLLGNQTAVDLLNENSGGESEQFCFKVVANTTDNYSGESNVMCFTLDPGIEIPNAFSPNGDGLNDGISPKIENVNVQDYIFIVYDRYGGKVFESKNENEKWWGAKNDKPVKEGAYIYYLSFKTAKGKTYEKSGSINVVFP